MNDSYDKSTVGSKVQFWVNALGGCDYGEQFRLSKASSLKHIRTERLLLTNSLIRKIVYNLHGCRVEVLVSS